MKKDAAAKYMELGIAEDWVPVIQKAGYNTVAVSYTHLDFFKEIGDRFFKVKSLKEVVDSLIKKNDDKAFYNYLIKNLDVYKRQCQKDAAYGFSRTAGA